MNKFTPILIMVFSMTVFSCSQNIDLYDIVIQNNSSSAVSGIISVTDEDDKSFTISSGGSTTIGVSAPYTVYYKNQYGKTTGTIDYSSNKIIFTDNPGVSLVLKNYIPEDVYVFTGGYIQGENVTAGDYKVDGSEGFKVGESGTASSTIYTVAPSFIVKTAGNISARISWTINTTAVLPVMTGVINY
jgi:hypothetical protein